MFSSSVMPSTAEQQQQHQGNYSGSVLWKVRDAAEYLLTEHKRLNLLTTSTTLYPLEMPLAIQFDAATCLHRIRRDKSNVVQFAFNEAATALLRAITNKQQQTNNNHHHLSSSHHRPHHHHGAAFDSENASDAEKEDIVDLEQDLLLSDDPDLPAILKDYRKLEQMRVTSFDRTHNNKEYTKRKGAKMDEEEASLTFPASAARTTKGKGTKQGRPNSAKRGKGSKETSRQPKKKGASEASSSPSASPPAGLKAKQSKKSNETKDTNATKAASSTAAATPTTCISKACSSELGSGSISGMAPAGPKFTRNTPASSAAALDFRFNSSRAILCAAGNVTFEALTPPMPGHPVDVLDVPQNPSKKAAASAQSSGSSSSGGISSQVNMGAVVVEAQTLGQRTISVVENAVRRSISRYQYRKDNARYDQKEKDRDFLRIQNPYCISGSKDALADGGGNTTTAAAATSEESSSEDDEDYDDFPGLGGEKRRTKKRSSSDGDSVIPYNPTDYARTESWLSTCLPRFLSVLGCGAGHAVYHDTQWKTRHGRIADLLRALSSSTTNANGEENFGPHLIITVEPELYQFAQEFHDCTGHFQLTNTNPDRSLLALPYQGSKQRRRKLRKYFSQAKGLQESPFHVLVTSYSYFLEDYLHFCQLPFEAVVLDDGVSWMAAAHGDQNAAIGSIWENGIWSANDQHIGLAGTAFEEWNFDEDELPDHVIKEAWVGLTVRHRIMTSATLSVEQKQSLDLIPVSGLISFVVPHFAGVVREEWDRSRVASDASSMDHFRKLFARSMIVHCPESPVTDMHDLAVNALGGNLDCEGRDDPGVPKIVYDDAFVSDGKINFSRRASLVWLGPIETSWLRYELGEAKLQNILDAMKISNKHGHFCEEITTASTLTSSGATGQVAGTMAYRLAIRCGRHFGSEQGLRQHVSALHAPPGTWLCRSCGSDCITSQARTHHERSCGQPSSGAPHPEQANSGVGATPTVGQGGSGKSGVGKKKANRVASSSSQAGATEEKDSDGSFRVPGYRGVWVNKDGKHFVKVDGNRFTSDVEQNNPVLFDNIDDAARKHDEVVKEKKGGQKVELNFKPDGSRIIYEDIAPASTSGLGGSAASVVPALSIINIKDLPKDVKPLLRDPRQTSRTGGNSKRHVYAYRGVCRQARKGHDRWQSQISFMGVNHYLGTFDSEWDAAAIYAWAHLILYGEEATRQAQKEGEEAAAAYEQEKRDIAAGKIPEPQQKPKKKKPPKKTTPSGKGDKDAHDEEQNVRGTANGSPDKVEYSKKRKSASNDVHTGEKKAKINTKACKLEKEAIGSTVAKGVTKAPILAQKDAFDEISDAELIEMAATRILASRDKGYGVSDGRNTMSTVEQSLRPCIPMISGLPTLPVGGALLVGLCPGWFGWDLQEFCTKQRVESDYMTAIQMLAAEYDEDGINEKFRTVMQGPVVVLGCAEEATYRSLGLGPVPLGGSVGDIDCHVGGVPGSCQNHAACIRYAPNSVSDFQIHVMSDDASVTLNGRRLTRNFGNVPLLNEDVCSVGARVFVFLLPSGE